MEVPIFEDVFGLTALDYCLGIDISPNPNVFRKKIVEEFNLLKDIEERLLAPKVEALNHMLANVILWESKDYSFLHAGDALVNGIIEALVAELPAVGPYLEARFKKCTT